MQQRVDVVTIAPLLRGKQCVEDTAFLTVLL